MNPLVSVIIPNYNHEAFLPKRLESVYGQTYDNIEVILLDDHSTDSSKILLKKYKHHKLTTHYEVNSKNSKNPFKQWKKGIELAKGDYIWIAESDDYADIHFLENLVPAFQKNKDIALVYCQSKKINQEGQIIGSMLEWTDFFHPNKWKNAYINAGNQEIQEHHIYLNSIPNASAVLFKNKSNIANTIHPTLKVSGDRWFWIHLIKDKQLAFIPKELNYFRDHPKTTRNINTYTLEQKKQNIKETAIIIQKIRDWFPNLELLIQAQKNTQINRLISWVKLTELLKTRAFIKEELGENKPFIFLFLRAYVTKIWYKLVSLKD